MAQQAANFSRAILQLKVCMWRECSDVAVCMCGRVCVWLQAVSEGVENRELYVSEEIMGCLRHLPIPPDYALTEYRALLHVHANNYNPHTV